MKDPTPDQVHEIIRAGILAPSADNYHHLSFEVLSSGLNVHADDELRGCGERHRVVMSLISLGAVIENVLLQAAAFGIGGDIQFSNNWQSRGLVAEIRWQRHAAPKDALVEAIPLRHTNRRFFHGPPLRPVERELIDAEVVGGTGVRLHWLDGSDRKAVLKLVLRAEAERFRRQGLHRELFSAIRFDVGWKRTCEEGLPPGALEVEALLRIPFAALRDWRLMRSLNAVGLAKVLGLRAAYLPCRLAPHLGVIAVAGSAAVDAFVAGRTFERVWLRAAMQNLALQPMAASVVLPFDDAGNVSDESRAALVDGWKRLIPGATPMMLFRLGRAGLPTVTTSRRDLARYMYPV